VFLCTSGCGGGMKIVPVSGKVMIDGKPLKRGVLTFNPNPAKGNSARISCRGKVQVDGRYELFTDDGSHNTKGAPLGWYKVTIGTTQGDDAPLPVNDKYTEFTQTDLEIEVVENPQADAYDLKFTR
jgi:hypothetical protein